MKNGIIFFITMTCAYSLSGVSGSIHKLPPGPYQQTCRKCTMVNGDLRCECWPYEHEVNFARANEWKVRTLLQAHSCPYSIVNDHGRLMCLPEGPYLSSSALCWVKDDTLFCKTCRNRNGIPIQVLDYFSLPNVSQRRYQIINNNAQLSDLPAGPYLNHCNECKVIDGVLYGNCSMSPVDITSVKPVSLDITHCKEGTITYEGGLLQCTKIEPH